ncbi:CBS domain-containing protein [Candidatus Woesearchaeota archaeon]|nr:CBS domain-containing protein [Candidatus Woesearchaeota archaeon]
MKTGYRVGDAMTKRPVFVAPGTLLEECARLMAEHHVGSLIIKDDGALLGVITEQDIIRKVVAKGGNPVGKKVEGYMVKKVVTISPEADIYEALVKMRDLNIRQLPVLHGKDLIGLLTLKDILKIEPSLFDLLVERFELREEKEKPIYQPSEKEGICEQCGAYTKEIVEVEGSLLCESCAKNV